MKTYWTIPGIADVVDDLLGLPCIGSYKYDGSNIRSSYNKKQGWRFGTRRRLFDKTDKDFAPAIDIFYRDFADSLETIFQTDKINEAICFFEYFGPSSFADFHDFTETFELVLIDVAIHKKGIVLPRDFIKTFGHLKSAEVIYDGFLTHEFIQAVRDNKYNLKEGVVVKGTTGGQHGLWFSKIKTNWWLEELKRRKELEPEKYAQAFSENSKEQHERIKENTA